MITQLYKQATFLSSAAHLSQLPPDEGIEVAFAGRSNVGKSSALNVITQSKRLARTSKTPGRTQMINLFELDDDRRLIDLPGYGYAKVPISMKQRWQQTLSRYLQTRQCLKGLILLMDIRHPLKPLDQHMVEWAYQSHLPMHILLTKADKLKQGAARRALMEVEKALKSHVDHISCQLFSSTKSLGIAEVQTVLDRWFKI